jgi:hypothetical protein
LSVIVTLPSCIVRKLASAPRSGPATLRGRFTITGAAASPCQDSEQGGSGRAPSPDGARWSLPLDGTELLPVYPALYEVRGDLPHFPVDVL